MLYWLSYASSVSISTLNFIQLNFFLFWQECMFTLCEVHTNFICYAVEINVREWLHIKFRKTCNAIFEKKLHKRRMKVLEKLCLIHRKLKLDKIKGTNAQHTMRPKFRENIRNISFLQICWFLIHMQSLNFLCNRLCWSPLGLQSSEFPDLFSSVLGHSVTCPHCCLKLLI